MEDADLRDAMEALRRIVSLGTLGDLDEAVSIATEAVYAIEQRAGRAPGQRLNPLLGALADQQAQVGS